MPVNGRTCCRALQRVVPRLILVTAYIFYLLFGGLVFSMIEGPRYDQLVAEEEYDFEMAKELLIQAYGNDTSGIDGDDVFDRLKRLVYAAEHGDGVMIGQHNKTIVIGEEWNFGNAMLFCMTSISTIGYGHLVPHTFIGGLICIMYTSVGIPLTMLLLADLGHLFAVIIMKMYYKCLAMCCRCGKDKGQKSSQRNSQDPGSVAGGSGGMDPNGEKENDRELDLTEIDVTPEEEGALHSPNGAENHHVDEPQIQGIGYNHQQDIDADDALLDDVPIFLPPIVFWSYIILSAPMFALIEGWSFPTSIYFLYISITTIGFGDVVPDCSIGLIFAWMGLVTTATCVVLAYRKILKVATWVLEFLDSLVRRERIRQRDARYSSMSI
ncbi:TWiK family of potassium channels protein 7-like [Lytechinus variegatus]|uniref:TWiK family of potassium channels protein 7-like n=1 Tax=Lytechinus variegatus TaxID=7654 RepID=UPI001BB13BD7|nr:TWiK family of potassium channels protein 7-like [Lytechinus variegatus]